MFPVLVHLGPLELPTYGLLMAVAFLLALRLLQTLGRRDGLDPEQLTSLWVWILVGGILGAKLTLYLVEWRYYAANPAALLTSWRAAGVYYGGFAAAATAAALYARRAGLPVGLTADACAPAIALGQSVGRLGCLAAGCCYGRPSELPWAITFTDPAAARITGVPLGIPRHPSQIYLSINALLLCGLLLLLWRIARRRAWRPGVVFWSYIGLYSVTRFWLEMYRGDPRGSVGPLSTSQAIALVGALLAAGFLVRLARRQPGAGRGRDDAR
ncbi:MAG: prolipoprotein diacylglyceryl transferase [Acidobacteriota bacterium]